MEFACVTFTLFAPLAASPALLSRLVAFKCAFHKIPGEAKKWIYPLLASFFLPYKYHKGKNGSCFGIVERALTFYRGLSSSNAFEKTGGTLPAATGIAQMSCFLGSFPPAGTAQSGHRKSQPGLGASILGLQATDLILEKGTLSTLRSWRNPQER